MKIEIPNISNRPRLVQTNKWFSNVSCTFIFDILLTIKVRILNMIISCRECLDSNEPHHAFLWYSSHSFLPPMLPNSKYLF